MSLDLTHMHNVANHGRGSEMTAALHECIDEIERLREERRLLYGKIEQLTNKANVAEKWKGIALARDGDGRTVNQIEADIRDQLREKRGLPGELVERANQMVCDNDLSVYDWSEAMSALLTDILEWHESVKGKQDE